MRVQFRIQLGAWKSVSCERCVLSGSLITRIEDSYWMWCSRLWSWRLGKRMLWLTRSCCAVDK